MGVEGEKKAVPVQSGGKPKANAQSFIKKGVALYEAGEMEAAAVCFKQALREDITNDNTWSILGVVLRKLGKHEASAACSLRALAIAPDNPNYLTNYGNCLVALDQLDKGLETHVRALEFDTKSFLIRYNYAIALRESGRCKEALPYFAALHKEQPKNFNVIWDAAMTHLQMGDFKPGWEAYEVRWKLPNMRERTSKTAQRWRGQDLAGKTLLIYEEQGFGDSMLCSRYIPLIKARGGSVILECKKPLHRLFSNVAGIVRLAEPGEVMVGFDYHVPMMSLPGIFKTDASSVPPPAPFYAAPVAPPLSSQLLALGKNHLKVGIVWSGSVTFMNNRKRAVDIERFLPLAEIPGVQLYSLQKGPREKELSECGADGLILDLGPDLNDFSETAAVLKELDLVIMTDSSVAHLAGSLNIPVWNLLCYRPYWLYLNEGRDCLWYPSMRLFRQPTAGDWDSVFTEVAEELRKMAADKASVRQQKAA